VVSVLATGPKGRRFKPGLGYGILRDINIHSTPFFGWEVEPDAPCHTILRHVKTLASVNEILARQNPHFFRQFLPLVPR
jgi:hypothetical protein